jgi:putative transposase
LCEGKTYRVYKELGMQLRNKTPKRRVKAKLRKDRKEAVNPNDAWAMDFVHDQLATGRKIRILTVVDTFSRYVPVLDARFSYKGEDVVANLSLVTWTSGLTNGTSRWTSQGRESRQTMPTSKRSTANSDPNA